MLNVFSKTKFGALSSTQQHKKAANLLRIIYESFITTHSFDPILLKNYHQLCDCLNIPALSPSKEMLSNRYHYHLHLANMSLKEHRLLPSIRSDDQPSDTPFLPIDIYLDHIRSAHNVGSIIRTTEALRLGSIYVPPIMTQLSSKKMQDTAMGTLDKVPYHIVEDISSLRTPLIALETSDEALSLYDYIFPKSFSLLLGNEEYGLSQNSLAKADIFLQIPLYGFKNSLNVACAFSIVAGEIRRQLS